MDKDRIDGAAKQAKGVVKEVLGDTKLQTEGKADQAEGRWQTAVGSLRDAHRKACAG